MFLVWFACFDRLNQTKNTYIYFEWQTWVRGRLSKKSIFLGISTYPINAAQRSIAFYLLLLVEMFQFHHFSDSLRGIIGEGIWKEFLQRKWEWGAS